jgi:stress-induced morphogen
VIEASVVEARIREHLKGVVHLEIRDLTGTQDHYDATIVATDFEGLSRVAQHQLVYRALGELMNGPVHALALKTFTPEAWAKRGESQ